MTDIGVVIPAYNRSGMLARAVRSVCAQEEPPAELVVVDDGSVEELEEAEALVRDFGGIWISLPENRGVAAARNAGVEALTTSWICFLDSDDEWHPDKLARQAAWHRDHPEVRISQVRDEWIRDGKPLRKPTHWEPGEGDLFADSVERCSISPSCVMMERSLLAETGGFDPGMSVCEDYDLWLRITSREWVGKAGEEILVTRYGGHEDQLSNAFPAMDRFRVLALLKLLSTNALETSRERLVREGILSKARILATGAERRNLERRARLYAELVDRCMEMDRSEVCEWIGSVRGEIVSSD